MKVPVERVRVFVLMYGPEGDGRAIVTVGVVKSSRKVVVEYAEA